MALGDKLFFDCEKKMKRFNWSKIIDFCLKHKYEILFYLILILLIIMPFFWFNHKLYLLGDDDTGLSYYEPLGTLQKFSNTWYSADALGKLNFLVGGEMVFSLTAYLVKIFTFGMFNLQTLAFSLILGGSFFFIVKILEFLNHGQKSIIYFIAGLFYALSPYFIMIEYYYLMPSAFVIFLAPLLTFYLLKSIQTNSWRPLLVAAVWTFFLSRAMMAPAFFNFYFLLLIFVLFYNGLCYGPKKLILAFFQFLKLSLLILLINSFIFIPILYGYISQNNNTINDMIADRKTNINTIVSNLKTELDIIKNKDFLIGRFPEKILKIQGFRDYPINGKYLKDTVPLMFIFMAIIFLGLLCYQTEKTKNILPVLALFLISFLFLSFDFFDFFRRFYLFLMYHTSIFNMNRYPSMKFHIPFIFYYALLIGLSFFYLAQKIKIKYFSYILFLICSIILIYSNQYFISGKIFTDELEPTLTKRVMDFDNNYKKLIQDFPKIVSDDTKLALSPLGYGYGAFILGQNNSEIYRSTATGFKNFTGYDLLGNLQSFRLIDDKTIFTDISDYYFQSKPEKFLDLARKLNIKYLIYTKKTDRLTKFAELIPSLTYQNEKYYDLVSGDPIYENESYKIFKIKNYNQISEFSSDKKDTEISFKKLADFMYLLKIKTTDLDKITMHEGFSKYWKIYEIKKEDFQCLNPQNFAQDYPNIYECQHDNNNISGNIKLFKTFDLKQYSWPHQQTEDNLNSWKINSDSDYVYAVLVMDGQKIFIVSFIFSLIILALFRYLTIRRN